MPTTITATPQPATASVLLEVTTDLEAVLDELAADLTWTSVGAAVSSFEDGAVTIVPTEPVAFAKVAMPVTAGQRYRLDVVAQRAGEPGRLDVYGGGLALPGVAKLPVGEGQVSVPIEFTPLTSDPVELWVWPQDNTWGVTILRLRLVEVPEEFAFTLTRTDANGTRTVRLFEGQEPVPGTGLVVTDYEAALAGPITYTLTTTEIATATTALDLPQTWLMVPVAPQYSARVELALGYTEDSTSGSTVHRIIGSDYPIVTLRPLGRRSGTLELWCPDYATAAAVRDVYRRGEVVMLRQADHPGLDLYHAATGRIRIAPRPERTAQRRWIVTLDYTETNPPIAPLSGALGWDYAASLLRHPTYADSAAEFPTYADRLIGPPA